MMRGHADAAHASGARTGYAERGIFDHDALRAGQSHPGARVQLAQRAQKRIGRGFTGHHILCPNHCGKERADAGAIENGLDLIAERPRCDRQYEARMQPPQQLGHAVVERRPLRQRSELCALAGDERVEFGRGGASTGTGVQRGQAGAIGQAEELREVVRLREIHPVTARHRLKRRTVQSFGVSQHTIEVEDHGAHRRATDYARHAFARWLDTDDVAWLSEGMADTTPATILLVDDEPAVGQSLAALLELETPYKVLVETSPQRAIQLAKVTPLDLVVSDFLMPELDGIGFLLEIRALYPESTLILLTGYADKENAIRAINDVGIFHYIEKPWDNDDLLTIITTGLDKRLQLHRLYERTRELEGRVQQLQQRNAELEQRLKGAT